VTAVAARVGLERRGVVQVIRFARQEKRNAITGAMWRPVRRP
jgi:enoyl-CoA hydratase/carnithine racemase